jgi:hypothetical protein
VGPKNGSKPALEGPRRPKMLSYGRFGASWGVLGAVSCPLGRILRVRPQTAPNRPEHAPKSTEHDPTWDRIYWDRLGSAPWRLWKRMLSKSTQNRPETAPRRPRGHNGSQKDSQIMDPKWARVCSHIDEHHHSDTLWLFFKIC